MLLNSYNYSKPKGASINIKGVEQKKIENKAVIVNKSEHYLEHRVLSAKPGELVAILYEGLEKFIRQSILSLEKNDIEKVNLYSTKAQAIVTELRSTLNMNVELSNQLSLLYDFIYQELFEGNVKKELVHFTRALSIVEQISDSWNEMLKAS